jgi:exopolyphosphatase / guanosine-5'-triphosphate,3'-diphosphate pyrophosphatase
LSKTFAAIDIGTNSALLLIAKWQAPTLEPILQKVATPRVGRNLNATGVISEESFQNLIRALEEFLVEIKKAGAILTGAVATQAFRVAQNGPELLEKISALLGIEARIIAGQEESRLSYLAVVNRHSLPNLAVLDIGGGSTELTRKGNGISLSIGAVSLLETYGSDSAACREAARAAFQDVLEPWAVPTSLVAVGGTASALAMLLLKLPAFNANTIEGFQVELQNVTEVIDLLASLSEMERINLPGMDKGRIDILMPGLCILEAFLKSVGTTHFRVSDRGIRYGIVLDWIKKHPPVTEAMPV